MIPTALATITIKPGEETEFIVGVYEEVIPQPRLSLDFKPEQQGRIYASLVRLDGFGDYTLKYYFMNPSSMAYEVTILVSWPNDEQPV